MGMNRDWRRWAMAAALTLTATAAAAFERPVAVVLDLRGQAELRLGDSLARLQLLDTLAPGAVLILASDANVVAGYATAVWDLRGAGRYEVRRDSIVALDAGARASKRAPMAARSLKLVPEQVVQGAVKLRGQSESPLTLIGPRAVVMTREGLKLEWRGPAGTYRVELIDDDGLVVASAELDRFSWALPPAIRLVEGQTYLWRVIALDAPGARREARAEFSLLPAAERRQWTAARPSRQASLAERTRYALALEQRGLNAEAAAQWRELAIERPQLAQRLEASATR